MVLLFRVVYVHACEMDVRVHCTRMVRDEWCVGSF